MKHDDIQNIMPSVKSKLSVSTFANKPTGHKLKIKALKHGNQEYVRNKVDKTNNLQG